MMPFGKARMIASAVNRFQRSTEAPCLTFGKVVGGVICWACS